MQKILGFLRRGIAQYRMIEDGDHIAVGVSGGKDSVVLALGLKRLTRFLGKEFTVTAITLDPCFGKQNTDYSPVTELLERAGIPHIIKRTNIGEIVFDIRKETNPCSLCARMRRGALHDAAKEVGCNKIALGHHSDDAVETFIMNLFHEGRIGTFFPVTYLSRKDVTVIRPLCLAPESEIRRVVQKLAIPVVKSCCPIDGFTQRQWTKEFLHTLEREHPRLQKLILGAIIRGNVSGWGILGAETAAEEEV